MAHGGTWRVEDLGVQAYGDLWLNLRHGIRPADGAEVAICSLSRGGFMVIDPAARSAIQVTRDAAAGEGWAIGQAPDGAVWQAGFSARDHVRLFRWNWQGSTSKAVAELPGKSFFTLDVGTDGCVYLPEYKSNTLYRFDPASGSVQPLATFEQYGRHIRSLFAAADGWLYVTAVDGLSGCIVAVNPATGVHHRLETIADGPLNWQYRQLQKDGAGRVLASRAAEGESAWYELVGGQAATEPLARPQLAATSIRQAATPPGTVPTALAFRDGSYISRLEDGTCEVTDAAGQAHAFDLERKASPLRIFSVAAGGDRIWGGTFIPLTLFSYEPATGRTCSFGNPTRSTGEIYAMAWSRGKLFAASYTEANITRYAPGLPWQPDAARPNPAHLGRMKDAGPPLHRIYGQTVGPDGAVFFAAKGDYGCPDSGIVRIDPDCEAITRWIYPDRVFGALCRLEPGPQLLVAERRHGEAALRFSRIDPLTGDILAAPPILHDEGHVVSWLPAGDGTVYGLHNHRATLFRYDPEAEAIIASLPELGVGDHCYNALIHGPDGRLWGLTNQCVYAVDRDLSKVERIADYPDHAGGNFYRFGLAAGPDGAVYFANGTHLMRLVQA